MSSAQPTSTAPSPAVLDRGRGTRFAPLAAFIASAVGFFALLLGRVWSNSVDVVFWDQWEFLDPFFREQGLWAAFRQQLGPLRQGVGAPVIAASNALSGWDMRALSVVTVCLLAVAMLAAVRLKVLLYGRLTLWDALIPPLFFRLSQAQAMGSVASPFHGALPMLLILCGCMALTVESRVKQCLLLTPLAFLTVHTGFAHLFIGALFGVLLIRAVTELLAGRRRAAAGTSLTIAGVVLMALTFLIGFWPKAMFLECEDEAERGLADYLAWVATQFSHYWGLSELAVPMIVVAVPVIGVLSVLVVATVKSCPHDEAGGSMRRWAGYSVPLALMVYSLAFSIGSAFGRLCGGNGFALSSRYVTHMIPMGLGLFFVLLIALRRTEGTRIAIAGVTALGVMLAALSVWGAWYVSSADRLDTEVERHAKLRWAECVRGGASAVDCDARAHFSTYPYPELLGPRIDYLRSRGLSFFSPDWSNPDADRGGR